MDPYGFPSTVIFGPYSVPSKCCRFGIGHKMIGPGRRSKEENKNAKKTLQKLTTKRTEDIEQALQPEENHWKITGSFWEEPTKVLDFLTVLFRNEI